MTCPRGVVEPCDAVSPKPTTPTTTATDTGAHRDPTEASTPLQEALPASVAAVQEHGDEAWPLFLREFSPFILTCIRRYAGDRDERMDIYVHVCTRLSADDCRRLRQYRGRGRQGACKFTTWLSAVVFNLAREWIRTSRGRRRLFRAIRDLNRTDRLVFKYYFWEGYSVSEIATLLRSRGRRTCDAADISQRLCSIERQLSRDHRWRLVTALLRSATPISLDQPRAVVGEGGTLDIPDPSEGCGARLQRAEARKLLARLVARLPERERLAVRLRFERGLSAREVAVALGIRNYKTVYEIQGRALARLARGLRAEGLELRDFLDPGGNAPRGPR